MRRQLAKGLVLGWFVLAYLYCGYLDKSHSVDQLSSVPSP